MIKKSLLLIISLCTALCLGFSAAANEAVAEDYFGSLFADSVLDEAPEGEVTAAEMMAAAVRLHSLVNGGSVAPAYDLDTYYSYATTNGIFADGVYTSEEQVVTRKEVVEALYNAVNGKVDLTAVNNAVNLPDSDAAATYYNKALSFTNAGIVTGYDKYGSFKPNKTIKRYEMSLMIDRLLNPSERVVKDYIAYAADEPFYLIDDFLMVGSVRSLLDIGSGWRYDYTGSHAKGIANQFQNTLTDLKSDDNISISRTIQAQTDGYLIFDTNVRINYGFEGLDYYFKDRNGNVTLAFGTTGTSSFYIGEESNSTYIAKEDREFTLGYPYYTRTPMRAIIDLDKGQAELYVAGIKVGSTYYFAEGSEIAEVEIATGIEEMLEVVVNQVHLSKNWHVNDAMRAELLGNAPLGYETSGNVTVERIDSQAENQGDVWSARIAATAGTDSFAKKSFEAITGKTVIETFMLVSDTDSYTGTPDETGAYFALTSAGHPVVKIVAGNNTFATSQGTSLGSFRDNIWQQMRIEADIASQTAIIKIRGKVAATVPFLTKVAYIDGLEIGIEDAAQDCYVWFDDVEAYETYDREDYVPEPDISAFSETDDDYYVAMSVCNLWRNGSHYGWSYIQPHHEPVTGFYDEGIPEAMDWELKFLAEAGFDSYNTCWYSHSGTPVAPLKKSRMNDAINDGYFNAKYSDYVSLSLMFENASMSNETYGDEFKQFIFPYWMDYYFSDPRYFTIEEDGKTYTFLTIYKYDLWLAMCSETEIYDGTQFTITDFTDAYKRAGEMIKWMDEQLVAAQISDGLIVGFNNNGQTEDAVKHIKGIIDASGLGDDRFGIYPYTWGTTADDLETQKAYIERGYEVSQSIGVDLLALPCIGFNRIGWYHEEKYGLISDEDLTTLLSWFKTTYMPRYASDSASWKQKYIQFATWNEYGEGHYFYPSDDNGGFDYMNVMAKAFGNPTSDDLANANVMPTEQQKARIGHLYTGDRHFIRRNFDTSVMDEAPNATIITRQYSWNPGNETATNQSIYKANGGFVPNSNCSEGYTKSSCKTTTLFHSWVCNNGTNKNCTFDYYYDGILTTIDNDPMITNDGISPFKAADADVAYITLEMSIPYTTAQLFFICDDINSEGEWTIRDGKRTWTAGFSYSFDVLSTGKVTYEIDLAQNSKWAGNITGIRLDIGSIVGNTVKIYDITFAKYDDSTRHTDITVDSLPYVPMDYGEIRSEDEDEIYIAPAESEYLYRMLHIVYDWHKDTGVLKLDTPNGTTIKFTVGSNIAVVNGKNVTLSKALELYDGVPVIPLIWILKTCSYSYSYDPYISKSLDISVADKIEIINVNNANAEDEGWTAAFKGSGVAPVIVADTEIDGNNAWYMSAGSNSIYGYLGQDFNFESNETYVVEFDAKLASSGSHKISVNAQYDSANHTYEVGTITSTEWAHFSVEFTIGNVTKPAGTFWLWQPQAQGAAWYMDNLTIRTKPVAFPLVNGDGSLSNSDGAWYSHNATIDTSNGYISVVPTNIGWTYLFQDTEFEAGVSYYFSVDVRLRNGTDGASHSTKIVLNARYDDLLRENTTTNKYDHTITLGDFTTSDEWTTCKGVLTISEGYMPYEQTGNCKDSITFFANPVTVSSANDTSMSYDIDNFIISTDYSDIFD